MSSEPHARLIVCEPKPRWVVLLRRFAGQIPVSEARSLPLADEMLAASPASFVAVAANEANAAALLGRLSHWHRNFPAATLAALLDEPNDQLQSGFLEAGSQLVIASLFDLPQVVRMAQRHLAQVEMPELDWREAVRARMPWPGVVRSP